MNPYAISTALGVMNTMNSQQMMQNANEAAVKPGQWGGNYNSASFNPQQGMQGIATGGLLGGLMGSQVGQGNGGLGAAVGGVAGLLGMM